jgi:hypothetical protein
MATPLDTLIDDMLLAMSDEDKERFKKEREDMPGVSFHFSLGMAMRNELGLWRNDTPLTCWFQEHNILHGDDRSATIYKALYCRLHGRPFDIDAEELQHTNFWRGRGLKNDGSPIDI